jgi:Zn finger protein HypA/HybF involved in hydrogenase expression
VLNVPCPKCGGEVHERYKAFQCVKCDFSLWKTISGRMFEMPEVEALIREKQIGPLQGFRSKLGKPFAAVLKLTPEFKVEFDFGQDQKDANGASVEVDFTGQEPVGKCPKCGARVFEAPMNYLCEKATGPNRSCDFRTGRIILQRPIERAQVQKLLETRKTDLLDKFISRKGRPFKAFLVVDPHGKVGFEFEPRERKAKKDPKTPPVKLDFTGLQPLGKCPRCGGKVFDTETGYVCERSQADKKPCKFKVGKTILQQDIAPDQLRKLLQDGRTDVLDKFISKAGKPFPACLVLDDAGKVTFEFPQRGEPEQPS